MKILLKLAKKPAIKAVLVTGILVTFFVLTQYLPAMAWTGPTAAPPEENLPGFIFNTSDVQTGTFNLDNDGDPAIIGADLQVFGRLCLDDPAVTGACVGSWSEISQQFTNYWTLSGNNIYSNNNVNNGNVGIGTGANTAQTVRLNIQDESTVSNAAKVRVTSLANNPEFQLQYGANNNNDHWSIYDDQTNDSLKIWSYNGSQANSGNRLTILQNGNVGIGQENPADYKLDVNGTIRGSLARLNSRNYWGEYTFYTPEFYNFLYAGHIRFNVSQTGFSAWMPARLFNNQYDPDISHIIVPPGGTGTITIDLTKDPEIGSIGYVYASGYIYLPFYGDRIPASVSGRVKNRYGSWTNINIIDIKNVSKNSSYAIWRLKIPISTYITVIEITINAQPAVNATLMEMEYQLERPYSYKSPQFDKFSPQTVYYSTTWTDDNGVPKVLVNASGASYFNGGKFGLGVTNPNALLHVSSTNADVNAANAEIDIQSVHGTNQHWGIYQARYGLAAGHHNIGDLAFWNGNASNPGQKNALIIKDENGYVGINNTNPSSMLDILVDNSLDTASALNITNSNSNTLIKINNNGQFMLGTNSPFVWNQNGNAPSLFTFNAKPDPAAAVGANMALVQTNPKTIAGNSAGFTLAESDTNRWAIVKKTSQGTFSGVTVIPNNFEIFYGDGTTSSFFAIKTNGNVGIGTVDPQAKLEINGQIKITGGFPGVGKVLTSDATGLASWTQSSTLFNEVDPTWGNGGSQISNIYRAGKATLGSATVPNTGVNLLIDGGIIEVVNGTTPGIKMAGSVVYDGYDGTLHLRSGGNYVVFDGNDTVGIGDTVPQRKLSVAAGDIAIEQGYNLYLNGDNDGNWSIGKDSSHNINVRGATGYDRAFRVVESTVGTELFRVNFENGNVGIGGNPGAKLDVVGDVKIDDGMAIDNDQQNNGTYSVNGLRFGGTASGEVIASSRTGPPNQYGLDFYTQNGTKRMSITNAGDVGIGTAAPGAKLDVQGTGDAIAFGTPTYNMGRLGFEETNNRIYLANTYPNDNSYIDFRVRGKAVTDTKMTIKATGEVGIGTTAPNMSLTVNKASLWSSPAIGGNNAGRWSYLHIGGSTAGHSIIWDSGSPMRFGTEPTQGGPTYNEHMRITSAGDVGIGSDAPSSLLEVKKTSAAAELTISNGITAVSSNTIGDLDFKTYDSDITNKTVATIRAQAEGTYSAGDVGNTALIFYTKGTGIPTEKMRIRSNGSVNINNSTSTAYKLFVSGPTRLDYLNINDKYALPTSQGTAGQFLSYNGTWATPAASAEVDGIIGNEVTGVVTNGGLYRNGSGTSVAPYLLGVNFAGTGSAVTAARSDHAHSTLQNRVSGTCAAGSSIRTINVDGTVTCEDDTDTNTLYSAGTGLTMSGQVFTPNFSYVQYRVSGNCAAGSSIRAIDSGGNVTCETDNDTDTNTTYSAGTGMTLTGTVFSAKASDRIICSYGTYTSGGNGETTYGTMTGGCPWTLVDFTGGAGLVIYMDCPETYPNVISGGANCDNDVADKLIESRPTSLSRWVVKCDSGTYIFGSNMICSK